GACGRPATVCLRTRAAPVHNDGSARRRHRSEWCPARDSATRPSVTVWARWRTACACPRTRTDRHWRGGRVTARRLAPDRGLDYMFADRSAEVARQCMAEWDTYRDGYPGTVAEARLP